MSDTIHLIKRKWSGPDNWSDQFLCNKGELSAQIMSKNMTEKLSKATCKSCLQIANYKTEKYQKIMNQDIK